MNVKLIDSMGGDLTVVNAARVSYAKESKELETKDEKLIKYLAEHNHWTPFAHVQVSFRIKAPVFVARQLVKHQIGLVWNETSRRYVSDEPELYTPPRDYWRTKPAKGQSKQGSNPDEKRIYNVKPVYQTILNTYNDMIAKGIAPEMARMILPQSMMTEWIWTGSLVAFARVCKLRCASDSQMETRNIANQIDKICRDLVHMCAKEFKKEENMEELKSNVLDPCVKYLVDRFYPYIIATCIIFILFILLAIVIIMLLLRGKLN